jgi:hypothetical protein
MKYRVVRAGSANIWQIQLFQNGKWVPISFHHTEKEAKSFALRKAQ